MSLRSFACLPTRLSTRGFHTSAARYVRVGDSIPSAELMENSPGSKVDISKEIGTKKALIIGVPAAFSTYGFTLAIFCSTLSSI